MENIPNNKEYNEILAYEDDIAVQCKNKVMTIRRNSTTIMVSNENNKTKVKRTQTFFELVFNLIGVKDQKATNETGSLFLLGFMLLLFIISLTGFFVMWFTEYYNNALLSKMILAKHSETAESWMRPSSSYDTLLKVHIFNYTNIDEYLSGKDDKIKVQDIGPITYKEHTTKVDVSFNVNGTVTFRDHRSYIFLANKSRSGEFDKVYVPNVPLFTADIKIGEMSNVFKKFGAIALIKQFKETAFKLLTAHEFLWGYPDRIVSLDFGTGKSHFGLLMNRNGTSVDSLQISTGETDITNFGIITQFNGMPLLDFWSEDQCNSINGTDASMFPPHLLQSRDQLHVFLQVLCRKLPLHFEKEVTILNNIEALRYRTPLNVFANPKENPDNKCYCQNTQNCMPSGVINATKCYNGAPIYPSFPHFFSGDPKIYEEFEGINPTAEQHQTYADIHPRFGFPISGASRIQINIAVPKGQLLNDKLKRIKENTILPLLWIEITSGDFSEDIIDKLYVSTFGLDAIQIALKYGTLLTCIISFGLIVAAFYYLNRRREEHEQLKKDIIHIAELEVKSNSSN